MKYTERPKIGNHTPRQLSFKAYCLSNLASKKAFECEPWSYQPKLSVRQYAGPEDFRAVWALPDTEHLFYSLVEGLSPTVRIDQNNPALRFYGLVGDYDFKRSLGNEDQTMLERSARNIQPNWKSRTSSGAARLVWIFEQPVVIESPELAKAFLDMAAEQLQARWLYHGWDDKAWKSLNKYYEVGEDWIPISPTPIPSSTVQTWLFDAAKRTNMQHLGDDFEIPLEVIAEEVEKRYPGRWDGNFEIGKRGVVFFNPDSTNPTAAQVYEKGMLCFSTNKAFYSWADIFGRKFVEKYRQNVIGTAAENFYFDGRLYWEKSERGVWDWLDKDAMNKRLKADYGLDSTKRRGSTASQLEEVIAYINRHRKVDGVAPSLFRKGDIFFENGKRYLNISQIRVMEPAREAQQWGDNFPWLAQYFDSCFAIPSQEQKDHFLAWFKRFYASAREGALMQGQVVFFAGPPGAGKTLLTSIVSQAMGGDAVASSFLLGTTTFNKELLESPVWIVDDAVAAQDVKAHRSFSERLKQAAANTTFSYQPKFKDEAKVSWSGRVMVALNDDDLSIRMVPELEPSVEDKIMLFRFAGPTQDFPPRHELEKIIATELPHFLRYLLDWEPPKEVVGSSRFGVKPYIHEELRRMAMNASGLSHLIELVSMWIQKSGQTLYGEDWKGTASDLLASMQGVELLRPLTSRLTAPTVGKLLSAATRHADTGITRVSTGKHKGTGNVYRIDFKVWLDVTEPQPEAVSPTEQDQERKLVA